MCCQHRGVTDLANVSMLQGAKPTVFFHIFTLSGLISNSFLHGYIDCLWLLCPGINTPRLDPDDTMFWDHDGMLQRKQISKDLISGLNLCCRKRPNMGTVISFCLMGSTGHLGPRWGHWLPYQESAGPDSEPSWKNQYHRWMVHVMI